MKALSDYLKVVGSDKQKYNSYLKWKSSHCVIQYDFKHFTQFCDLCKKLNVKPVENTNKVRDLMDWWFKQAECNIKEDITKNDITKKDIDNGA